MQAAHDALTQRRLRVLVLARSYPNPVLPTLGLWTERTLTALADRCDFRVVSPVPYCPPLPRSGRLRQYTRFRHVPRELERAGVLVHHPRFLVGPGSSLHALEADAYALAVRGLADRLWRERPFDLIHANFIYPDGVVAHRLSQRLGVPFVVTEHAPWTGWLERRSVRRRALPAAQGAAALIAVSSSVERSMREYDPALRYVRVVPVPVDEGVFVLGEAPRRSDQILYVGFLNFNKGIDVLLRAVVRLRELGRPGRVVLAGGALYRHTRVQEQQLRRLAADLELDDRVEFLGRQDPGSVARLMRESAVVVLPSRAESFGAVLTEALASGTPVVATRCGGPEDIVNDDVGLLVPVGDADALASALSTVLRRSGNYAPDKLRAYAMARFGGSVVSDKVYDVYVQVREGASAKQLYESRRHYERRLRSAGIDDGVDSVAASPLADSEAPLRQRP